MALISEYALTPDVFDETCYGSVEVCGVHLQGLKEILLHEALVRDLRDGEWGKLFLGNHRPWHLRGKELLKKLVSQRRLLASAPAIPATPARRRLVRGGARLPRGTSPNRRDCLRHARADTPGQRAGGADRQPGRGRVVGWAKPDDSIGQDACRLPVGPGARRAPCELDDGDDPYIDPSNRSFQDIVTVLEGAAGRAPSR